MADKEYFEKAEEIPDEEVMKSMTRTRSGKPRNITMKANKTNYSKLANTTVKLIKRGNIHISRTDTALAQSFFDSLQQIPMYLIYAHSCVCPEKGDCWDERKVKNFTIPKDTYIINFVQPGDFFCGDSADILLHKDSLRSFLAVHSTSDIKACKKVGKSAFSFFSGLTRATSSQTSKEPVLYPNINFDLNEHVGGKKGKPLVKPEKNDNGVYAIDDMDLDTELNNTISLFKQSKTRHNWFLKDIIHETYAITGIKKGIFLLGGCLDVCHDGQTSEELDKAAEVIHLANSLYPTLRETFTKEEMRDCPMDYGIDIPSYALTPSEAKHLAKLGVTDPIVYKQLPMLHHPNNAKVFAKIINKHGK